jgi:hypothetical protein
VDSTTLAEAQVEREKTLNRYKNSLVLPCVILVK